MVDLPEKNLVKILVKSCKSLIAFIILASPSLLRSWPGTRAALTVAKA